MDITQAIGELKKDPRFTDNVGMILVHNGVVRGWSRQGREDVVALEVTPDQAKVEALRREYETRPGIWRVLVEAKSGRFQPGDDLLYIVVAGDLRENVLAVLTELLNRIKAEAVTKREIKADEG